MWISDKQKLTMKMVNGIVEEFGQDRWFTQCELPGITLHSIDALVSKGFLERKDSEHGIAYYRMIKTLE